MFSPQDEIWDYLRHCVDKYDLAPHIRYDAEVTGAAYDEATTTLAGRGQRHRADRRSHPRLRRRRPAHAEASRTSRASRPSTGTTFHSARWRHDLDLTGRNVAVIGTGASAVQFVPQIAPDVAQLDVYQRSAPWVTPKPNPRDQLGQAGRLRPPSPAPARDARRGLLRLWRPAAPASR